MLEIYKRFWQVNWAEQWQYRANMLMYLLYWLVSPVTYLAVWTTIAKSQGSVRGLTPNDFVTYYMALLVIDQLTSEITLHLFATKIQDGTLSGDLLRPVHPVLTNVLVNNLAFKSLTFLVFLPVWGVLFLLFKPDFSSVTLQSILLAAPGIALGFCINFLVGATITSLAFWTTRVYSVSEFFYAFIILFSGQFVPLTLMPELVQRIAVFLPFQLNLYVPIQIVLNRHPPEAIVRDYAAGLVWLVIAFFVFRLVWRNGLRRFSAVGA